jgi:hypothetical protein
MRVRSTMAGVASVFAVVLGVLGVQSPALADPLDDASALEVVSTSSMVAKGNIAGVNQDGTNPTVSAVAVSDPVKYAFDTPQSDIDVQVAASGTHVCMTKRSYLRPERSERPGG